MQPKLIIQGLYEDLESALGTCIGQFVPSNFTFEIHRDSAEFESRTQYPTAWRVAFGCDDAPNALIVGDAQECDVVLARSLIKCALSHFSCEQQLTDVQSIAENYAIQVTSDFEELVWLRSLAEQFTHCDVRNSMRDVAQQLLPSLRIVLNSDCIYYISGAKNDGVSNDEHRLSDGLINDTLNINDLVTFATNDRSDNLYIFNSSSFIEFRDAFPKLHSCMLCRLGVGDDFFGWLIALRYPVQGYSLGEGEIDEREFGTFEGGLISSAATLFQTHGRNIDLVQQKEGLLVGAVRSLINSIDAKDPYTFGHSDRVAGMSRRIAVELGFDAKTCEQVYMTGLLHDIGKIGIPDSILGKPSRLTDEEFAIIQQHPVIGYKILKHLDSLSYTFSGVLHHHESYDGRGYPDKLVGEAIPLNGRILAVADSFDAMTSSRPYRNAMSFEKAESIVREGAGKQWDPKIVDAFFAAISDIRALCMASANDAKANQSVPVSLLSSPLSMGTLAEL